MLVDQTGLIISLVPQVDPVHCDAQRLEHDWVILVDGAVQAQGGAEGVGRAVAVCPR